MGLFLAVNAFAIPTLFQGYHQKFEEPSTSPFSGLLSYKFYLLYLYAVSSSQFIVIQP